MLKTIEVSKMHAKDYWSIENPQAGMKMNFNQAEYFKGKTLKDIINQIKEKHHIRSDEDVRIEKQENSVVVNIWALEDSEGEKPLPEELLAYEQGNLALFIQAYEYLVKE